MLNILIVDDNSEKVRNIIFELKKLPDIDASNFEHSSHAIDAKRRLKQKLYDLVILDIALPNRPDDDPSEEGGIALLEEILNRETKFHRPKHIVGLTAFPDILQRVAKRFAADLWMVVQYDPSSGYWAEQLRRKVMYIQLANRSEAVPEHGAYLGVITALHSPELTALLETVPWNWSSVQQPFDSLHYFKGSFEKSGNSCNVIAVACPRMGMTTAAVTSMKLISSFRPRYLAMIGIAAGIKGRGQLGDIVAADPSWDWGSGKITKSSSGSRFEQAPYQLGVDPFLRAKLTLLSQDGATLDVIRRTWAKSSVDHVLRMYVGPMASGAAVLADQKTAKRIIAQHRKLLSIEMETYGVFEAAQEAPLPQPKAFSIKSICDFADEKKNDSHQEYASFTSAQALKHFVERYL